jgi:hypothetical protein
VVHSVCCLAGAVSLIDDIRAELRAEGIPTAIRCHDTATLFDWLISALSYQGILSRSRCFRSVDDFESVSLSSSTIAAYNARPRQTSEAA